MLSDTQKHSIYRRVKLSYNRERAKTIFDCLCGNRHLKTYGIWSNFLAFTQITDRGEHQYEPVSYMMLISIASFCFFVF